MALKKIIGLSGLIGSGKDTVANYLVNQHNFERKSFAGSLKDAVSSVFGWDRQLLEGLTPESRKWREKVDTWWAQRLGIPNLTPRWILQNWGTNVLRNYFHNDIWIASIENQLRLSEKSIVITDVRFPNEYYAIRNYNGLIFRIKRGPDPLWYQHAVNLNTLEKHDPCWLESYKYLKELMVHESETACAGMPVDFIIDNDQTIQNLYTQIDNIIQTK